MKYNPKPNIIIDQHEFSYKFFETLQCVSKTWSQREAAKMLGIAHAVLNRRIKKAEDELGIRIVETTGAGSGLTDFGYKLLEKYQKYVKRLEDRSKPVICGGYISAGLMEVLAKEYHLDADVYQTNDESALELARKDMVDILTLDDPVRAFLYDLDLTPVAYDHLVMVSKNQTHVNVLSELNGKNFLEVPGSSQRLAWNSMDNMDINYEIVNLATSPYNALKTVKNCDELYTFLNSSFIDGSNILRDQTKHLISLVLCNTEDVALKNFVDFIHGNGQKIVENCGFERI